MDLFIGFICGHAKSFVTTTCLAIRSKWRPNLETITTRLPNVHGSSFPCSPDGHISSSSYSYHFTSSPLCSQLATFPSTLVSQVADSRFATSLFTIQLVRHSLASPISSLFPSSLTREVAPSNIPLRLRVKPKGVKCRCAWHLVIPDHVPSRNQTL